MDNNSRRNDDAGAVANAHAILCATGVAENNNRNNNNTIPGNGSAAAAQSIPSDTIVAKNVEPTTPQIIAEAFHEPNMSQPPQIVYVTYSSSPANRRPYPFSDAEINDNDRENGLWCVMLGFLFSWIPIIGIITFCLNLNAPARSQRAVFANLACFVAGLVIFLNILILPTIYRK